MAACACHILHMCYGRVSTIVLTLNLLNISTQACLDEQDDINDSNVAKMLQVPAGHIVTSSTYT